MITKLKSFKFIGVALLTGLFMQLSMDLTHDLYLKVKNRNKIKNRGLFRKLRKAN